MDELQWETCRRLAEMLPELEDMLLDLQYSSSDSMGRRGAKRDLALDLTDIGDHINGVLDVHGYNALFMRDAA